MITNARIRGYKSLRGVDIELGRLTVIFGPNSAGKSNLFDALDLLARMATDTNLDTAFKGHRGEALEAFSFGSQGVQDVLDKKSTNFTLEVDVHLDDDVVSSVEAKIQRAREGLPNGGENERRRRPYVTERRLRYRVTVEIRTESGHLRIMDESLMALRVDGEPRKSRSPFLEKQSGRLHLRMEKQSHPTYEELGQDRTVVSKGLYAPHYPHITAFQEEVSRWRFYYLEPTAMRDEAALRDVESLDARGTQVAAFYNALSNDRPKQFEAVKKSLRQVVPSVDGLDVERTSEGRLRLVVREEGMAVSARLISEGTLRVLGLMAITNPLEPVSVVGYEEPENGVHPRRLALVAQLLRGVADRGSAQMLVNTHSPVLPEYFLDDKRALVLRCLRDGRKTVFEEFDPGPLFAEGEIANAFDDDVTPFRERIVRGDFGG